MTLTFGFFCTEKGAVWICFKGCPHLYNKLQSKLQSLSLLCHASTILAGSTYPKMHSNQHYTCVMKANYYLKANSGGSRISQGVHQSQNGYANLLFWKNFLEKRGGTRDSSSSSLSIFLDPPLASNCNLELASSAEKSYQSYFATLH